MPKSFTFYQEGELIMPTLITTPPASTTHPVNFVSFFQIFYKLGDFIGFVNAIIADDAAWQSGQPVDLGPLAVAAQKILTDFGVKLPAWADNSNMVLLFLQGGINAVSAHKPNP
jgi:hypothetical protein